VSCTSATLCTATGSADALTLAVRWNGAIWSTQQARNASYEGDLQGVSCVSRTFCGAVGWAASDVLLAERWDGLGWSTQQTAIPSGAKDGSLSGVSCVSITACTAVGYYTSRGRTTSRLAEHWNGVGWSIRPIPSPARAKDSGLSSVSCVKATACIAVGSFTGRAGTTSPLAERWNGRTWSLERTPSPAQAKDTYFSGISCLRVRACVAVGSFTNRAGKTEPLAERSS
jgi:hypothetical protein